MKCLEKEAVLLERTWDMLLNIIKAIRNHLYNVKNITGNLM